MIGDGYTYWSELAMVYGLCGWSTQQRSSLPYPQYGRWLFKGTGWPVVLFLITGQQVAQFLTQLFEKRTKPESLTCDNGLEFTSKATYFWSKEHCVKLNFIQPGKSTQNGFVESLNGQFRYACLNQHWFKSIEEAI